jgi:hypothetical protein
MKLEYFAKRVAVEKSMIENNNAAPVAIDPATIMLITSISIKIIKCLVKRYGHNAEKVKENIDNPGFRDKVGLKRAIIMAIGWRRYRKDGASILEALLKTGGKLRIDDIYTLLTEGL